MTDKKATESKEMTTSEKASENLPAAEVPKFDVGAVKAKRTVTRPVLTYKLPGAQIGVQITEPFYRGKDIEGNGKRADLANVINLVNGDESVIVLSAVIKGNLEENYPEGQYVGRCFFIENCGKREGKRYIDARIIEIEPTPTADMGIYPAADQVILPKE